MSWVNQAYSNRTAGGDLRKENVGEEVLLLGWVFRYRDNGGVIFFDLRDSSGLIQVVFERSVDASLLELADSVRTEYVVAIRGKIRARSADMVNPKLDTGEIEVVADDMEILNRSQTIPFSLEDFEDISEELRLKHRYLDLRKPEMQNMLRKRHELLQRSRSFLNDRGFLEIETPILNKSTPEGARDFLVPSRMHPGEFYALPQSPQIFKQVLMASGVDRYYQVVKCFRDEDLRSDRQPEFTQLDLELAFVDEEVVMQTMEDLWKDVLGGMGMKVPDTFPRIKYHEAMERFGCDRPDMRFGVELIDVADICADSDFKVFRTVVESGGRVKAICVPGGAALSRKDIDDLTSWLGQDFGAKGLAWLKHGEEGLESVIAKFFKPEQLQALSERLGSKQGDIVLFGAGEESMVHQSLSALRLKMADRFELYDKDEYHFIWVTDFPLLEKKQGRDLHGCPPPLHLSPGRLYGRPQGTHCQP
jgi:aspartyl-tRNA synthetase